MKKSGFMEMSFGWLFALIVGAFIIFLAIFFVIKFMNSQGSEEGVKTSRNIEILLDPLESGSESARTTILDLGKTSKIKIKCEERGIFGEQKISTTPEAFDKDIGNAVVISSEDDYIFSLEDLEASSFYVFSKKLEIPFKVTDLTYIIPRDKEYCFISPPDKIKNETYFLNLKNVINVTSVAQCPAESERICFDSGVNSCDRRVDLRANRTTIKGDNDPIYFSGDALMYGSIFSDKETYECQAKRIMKRLSILSELYDQKKEFVKTKECNSQANLALLKDKADSYVDTQDLDDVFGVADQIKSQTEFAKCQLW